MVYSTREVGRRATYDYLGVKISIINCVQVLMVPEKESATNRAVRMLFHAQLKCLQT